jgi:hypothetical protein
MLGSTTAAPTMASSSSGGTEPLPKKVHFDAVLGCPPGMCVELPIICVAFYPPIFVSKLKILFFDGRNFTSGTPIVRWSVMRPVSPPHPDSTRAISYEHG